MTPTEAQGELCRLAVVGLEEGAVESTAAPESDTSLLLGLESLSLTLDDPRLRSVSLASLAMTRAERGEEERSLELARMAQRTGEARVEVAVLLGLDAEKRFE